MDTRPASLLGSVVLVGLTGVAALLVAALLAAVAGGAVVFLDGARTVVMWAVAIASATFGAAAVAAAVGLWARLPWAWPAAAGVQLLGTLGAIVALATSGAQPPTVLGTLLVAAGLVVVLASDTRRALAV
jgi:hypothetical protein